MPIKFEQLDKVLSQPKRCGMIAGDDPLLVMQAQDKARAAARKWGVTERNVFNITRSFDFNSISVSADNLSLFSEQKLIELRFEKLPDKKQQNELMELLSNENPDTYFLITCPKLEKRQLSSKWVKQIESIGYLLQVWPIPSYQLQQWVTNQAKEFAISLSPQAIQVLVDRSEGNLLAARQDLEKLSLLNAQATDSDGQPVVISEQEVLASVAHNARYTVFELIDTAMTGNVSKVADMIHQLQQEGVATVIIVASLYRECRQMLKMSLAVSRGQSISAVVKEYRVWPSRSRLISQTLSRVPPKVWQRVVVRCAHLDKLSKGAQKGNIWDDLLTCLVLIGGRPLWKKLG
ncbi:MAG: DNA polymerase III subunit delta [Kangiellaceae bacterium]|jgi:DNA polymerase-3 subunit delta|nr:DNA polymerase III subunit delta [Kangiellaceae bacterium]